MRKPVVINDEMLRAIFTKPRPSDTRGFVARLLASTRIAVKGSMKKGITFISIRGGADF